MRKHERKRKKKERMKERKKKTHCDIYINHMTCYLRVLHSTQNIKEFSFLFVIYPIKQFFIIKIALSTQCTYIYVYYIYCYF